MNTLLNTAWCEAVDASTSLIMQANSLRKNPVWEILILKGLVREVTCTTRGLIITPQESPLELLKVLATALDVVFTREKQDSGLYDWVTTVTDPNSFNGFQLYIEAGESFDQTGSVVRFDQF